MSDKQLVLETLNDLPEGTSLAEIIEKVQSLASIRQGQNEIAQGLFKSHDEVKSAIASWNSK